MTIVRGSDLGDMMRSESVRLVSADVSFVSDRFPSYLIGANDRILDPQEDPPEVPSIKEIVAQESAQLVEQQKRLSVRDLASKFEKGLAAAAKLSDEAKFREAASLEGQVLLKKLRDVLEWLRGRVSGRNKDDVEDAIAMVEALAVQLTHREGELLQEKTEVKKLASFLKQASEDAKKVAERARAFAQAEVGSARAAVKKIEQAMQEQENVSRNSDRQNTENLMQEVQEARRIKVLHQPTKVMGMEYEVQALRVQLAEKSMYALQLWKELEMSKRVEEKKADLYELDGSESLGSYLWIVPCTDSAPDISQCTIQWFRKSYEGSKREMISGAIKSIYAPEPFDVGRFLQVEIVSEDQRVTVTTTGPIDPAAGLGNYVETLLRKADSEFNVSVIQMNGHDRLSHSVHVFHVGKKRIKLRKGRFSKAKEPYSASMQLCGVRGSGNAAARALFWQVKKGLSFTLAFESERERNAAIMLARRFALDCNIMLAGPGDYAPPRTH